MTEDEQMPAAVRKLVGLLALVGQLQAHKRTAELGEVNWPQIVADIRSAMVEAVGSDDLHDIVRRFNPYLPADQQGD